MTIEIQDVSIRAALHRDAAAVLLLAREYGLVGSPNDAAMQHVFRRMVDDPERLLLVADAVDSNGTGANAIRVIGYAYAQDYGQAFRCDFATGRLHDIFVAPQFRGLGAGRLLIDGVVAWARARPLPIILDWQATPDAIAFYERIGFTADYQSDQAEYPAFCLDTRP